MKITTIKKTTYTITLDEIKECFNIPYLVDDIYINDREGLLVFIIEKTKTDFPKGEE